MLAAAGKLVGTQLGSVVGWRCQLAGREPKYPCEGVMIPQNRKEF